MPKPFKIALLSFSVIVSFALLAGGLGLRGVRAADAGKDANAGAYTQIDVYRQVLGHIQSDYVVDPKLPVVTEGALRGLLESLDSESSYLSADQYKTYKDHMAMGNATVGITVAKRYGYATIVAVQAQSPADKAGIVDGDVIIEIEKASTHELPLALIRALMVGKAGTPVSLAIVKPGTTKPTPFTLTRAVVAMPSIADEQYDGGNVLYLKPGTIGQAQVSQIEQKLKATQKPAPKKVLLDLRDVTGGDMHEAVRLANLFLDKGTIASLTGQTLQHEVYTADPAKAIAATVPLVVLVNTGTQGAAEIVADALIENHRGDAVGERSFGEASELKLIDMPDGSALLMAVGKYESPAGKTIEDDPAMPNVIVASAADAAEQAADDEDEDGDDAAQAAPAPPVVKPGMQKDDQLQKALELLRGKTAAELQVPAAVTYDARPFWV